jgi:WD40 repeat protein
MQKHFLPLIIIAFTFTSTLQSVSSQTTTRPAAQTTQRSLKLVRSFEAHSTITAVDMSRDGETLITASKGDVQIWNLDTGDEKTHSLLDSQYANIKAIAISPDQQTFLTGSSGLDITTQSNSSGCTSSSGNGNFSWSCNLGGSSTQTIKSTSGSAIQVWEVSTGRNISTLESSGSSGFGFGGFGGVFDFFSFSTDGNMLITSQSVITTCQTNFRDLKTGKVITQLNSRASLSLKTDRSCKQTLAINPRESRQVVYASDLSIHNIGSDDKPNRLSLRLEGKELEIDESFSDNLNISGGSIVFSPDGKNIAVSDRSSVISSVFIWQPEVNKFPQYKFIDERANNSNTGTLSFSPDNQYLAFGDEDGIIRLWDFKNSKQPNRTIAHSRQPIQFIGFSPNGKTLVSVGSDRTIKIWQVN